jgi:hypothetical protein
VYTSVVQSLFRRKIRKLWTRIFFSAALDEKPEFRLRTGTARFAASRAGCMT